MAFTSINEKVGRDLVRMLYTSTETFGTPTPGGNRQVEVVFVGSLLDASANIYDGMIVYVNHDLTAIGLPDHVFLMEANNAALTPGDYVVACRQTEINVIHEGTSSADLGSFTSSGAGDGGGDIRPLFVCGSAGGTDSHECTLPTSATQLAQDSPQGGGDPIAGLAAWTHDDELQIQLSGECCFVSFVDRFCSDDGTHMECKRRTLYFPFKIKEASGPTEDDCPPPDWNQPCSGSVDE